MPRPQGQNSNARTRLGGGVRSGSSSRESITASRQGRAPQYTRADPPISAHSSMQRSRPFASVIASGCPSFPVLCRLLFPCCDEPILLDRESSSSLCAAAVPESTPVDQARAIGINFHAHADDHRGIAGVRRVSPWVIGLRVSRNTRSRSTVAAASAPSVPPCFESAKYVLLAPFGCHAGTLSCHPITRGLSRRTRWASSWGLDGYLMKPLGF